MPSDAPLTRFCAVPTGGHASILQSHGVKKNMFIGVKKKTTFLGDVESPLRGPGNLEEKVFFYTKFSFLLRA